MTYGRKASIVFKTVGNQTNVNLKFDTEDKNPLEMQIRGRQSILDNF